MAGPLRADRRPSPSKGVMQSRYTIGLDNGDSKISVSAGTNVL